MNQNNYISLHKLSLTQTPNGVNEMPGAQPKIHAISSRLFHHARNASMSTIRRITTLCLEPP